MAWLQTLAAKILIGALMGAAIFAGGFIGGRQAGRMEQLADTVKAYEKREKIDAKVRDATGYELCISLGGLPDRCAELRRMDPAAESE